MPAAARLLVSCLVIFFVFAVCPYRMAGVFAVVSMVHSFAGGDYI